MKTEFRNRAFLPIALPLIILVSMAAMVGLFAWIMLYNTKDGAVVLASVMALGILISIAFAASKDSLDARAKAGVLLAVGAPVLIGVGLASTGGGVEDAALLNINTEPHETIPALNVTLHAENSNEFVETQLTLPAGEEVAIVFVNEEVAVPHNVAIKPAGADGGEPDDLGDPIAASAILPGPSESFVAFTVDPGAYWFWCQVHPNMNGVLTAEEGAEPAAA